MYSQFTLSDRWTRIGLTVLAFAFFAVELGTGSHFDSDDCLYAQMAREMWSAGDWVDNRWSDTILFEKPPLLLWTLAVAGHLGDWSEGALRFPLVCFAALAIWSLYGIYRCQRIPSTGAVASCLFVMTSFSFIVMTRRLMMDLPMVACVLFALYFALQAKFIWSGFGAGLAILAKGVAAGPLIMAVLVIIWLRQERPRRRLFPSIATAAATAFLVAAPWHIASTLRHGFAFWEVYVGHHVGVRASTAVVPGISLTDMALFVLRDWVLVVGASVGFFRGLRARLRGTRVSPMLIVGVVWSLIALLPVLYSSTRLPHYAFPFVVGLGLLAPTGIPRTVWKHRYAPAISGLAVVVIFMLSPARLAFWINADLAPAQKAIGTLLADHAEAEDMVAAFNTTTAALTFYSNGKRIEIFASDPTFLAVQRTVLMNDMVGLVREVGDRAIDVGPNQRRFVVARRSDRDEVVSRFLRAAPVRPVSVVEVYDLVLVNDADVGVRMQP